MILSAAADYIRTSRPARGLLAILRSVRKIFTFAEERANRLARFVVIARAYARGVPVREIEAEHGCSRNTVLRYARAAGLPRRPKHFPADIRAAVLRDYRAGMAVADIARLHRVSPAYVSKTATEEGISRYRKASP